MDKFTYFEIRRDKRRHANCEKGIYKEGFEYYKKHWPEMIGDYLKNSHFYTRKDYYEFKDDNNKTIGCDNCVELWFRESSSLRSEYGLDKKNEEIIKSEEVEKEIKEKEKEKEKKKEKVKLENESLKQENNKFDSENEKLKSENEKLKSENNKFKSENYKILNENSLLKQENQKLKSDFNNQKNSMKNLVSSIESDVHQHLLQELTQLKDIIDKSRKINFKDIRKFKLPDYSCTSDKDILYDFICSVCLDIVENPVNCSMCDKLNCRECINFTQACPNCKVGNIYNQVQIPRIVKNTLSNLKILCPLGCLQEFKYEFKETHISECVYKDLIPSKCSLCNLTLNEDLGSHSKKCNQLKTKCPYCNIAMSKLDLEEHMKECKSFILPCEICKVGFPNMFQKAHSDYYCNKIIAIKKNIQDFIHKN